METKPKTTAQRVSDARVALQRAMARQRKEDARQKIIVGATAWNWLSSNPNAAKSFIRHVEQMTVREQDKHPLAAAIAELKKKLPAEGGVQPA